jgi:murein DD-endopeptidase MepM/ murein hydrolase activator NlpD
LFSFDLDFQRDIKSNTQVSISYQKINVDGKYDYSFGDIEYARINIKKNNLEYFKFITDDDFVDYFNREGKNVKKSILKTPLDGARLSSSFGMRKHPISGFNKMHKGIDFAAPKGTPIYAGGNGIIEVAGTNGGYGKYIRIRHNNEYKTAYAHLSSYKKGIGKGVRVNQGQVIGYVGSTGKSTGPHLHYEIIFKNKQINPLTLKLPSGKILKGGELKRFKKKYKLILANHLNNLFE